MSTPASSFLAGIFFVFMNTRATNPQQVAIERIIVLQDKIHTAHNRVSTLLDIALIDAVQFKEAGKEIPVILSEDALVELTRVKNELSELNEYYQKQRDQLTVALRRALTDKSENAALNEAVERLRERSEQMSKDSVPRLAVQKEEPVEATETPAVEGDYQPVMPAREITAARREDIIGKVEETVSTLIDGIKIPDPESTLFAKKNHLERILGDSSVLLDLFAPGPWLANGRGTLTVGSEDFQWHQGTNPLQKAAQDRAQLPSGFYAGDSLPECVLIRLETVILVWSFELTPESMLVYIAGISDTYPQEPRWFRPTDLSASYTRRIVTELEAFRASRG